MRQTKHYIFLIVLFCGFFYGCIDDPKVEPGIQNAKIPQLGTTVKIERTATSITLTASVEKANGAAVEERGLCWSKKAVPPFALTVLKPSVRDWVNLAARSKIYLIIQYIISVHMPKT